MINSNQYIKPELKLSQHINYMAVALIHLAGNELPSENEIQNLERKLKLIVKKYYLKNLIDPLQH